MVRLVSLAAVFGACWTCAPARADVLPIHPPAAAVNTAEQVVETVRPVVAPADVTVRKATTTAQPAVQAAVSTTVHTAPGRVDENGGLRVGASSLRRAPSARLRRPEPPAGATKPARPAPAVHTARRDAQPEGQPRAAHPTKSAHPADARSGVVPHLQVAPSADGGLAAGGAGGFAAGLALLAVALIVLAPRLSRRIRIDVSAPRPFTFVALLERPG